ncbi:MAG: ATP-dependent DNA ligase [Candidatus Micrarchaeota archaeon]
MRFADLAEVFELMEKTASRLQLTEQLAAMYFSASPSDVRRLTYLYQGILVPESLGIQIGVGDKLTEAAIGTVSGKSIKQIEETYRKEGDLGATAKKLLMNKMQSTLVSEELSVKKVYENFFRIATSSGFGSQDSKIKLLAELLSNAEPAEAKHIVRFVQGSLRLGVGEPTILDALAFFWMAKIAQAAGYEPIFSKEFESKKGGASSMSVRPPGKAEGKKGDPFQIDSKLGKISGEIISNGAGLLKLDLLAQKRSFREIFERAFNMRSDLGEIAEMVVNGKIEALKQINPQVFSPIRPALAERLLTPGQIIEKIGKCSVEGKYDGFRLQVHKKGNEVKIFSRKEEPMTHMFPDVVDAVKTEFKAKEAIFEGEAIAYDDKQGKFLPFQVTIQRKRKHDVKQKAREIPLKLFAFELLYADGSDYTREPYEKRREDLGNLIAKNSKTLKLSERIIAETPKQLQQFFEKCLSDGLEGIIAKDLQSPYIAGARKFAWIKLKKSYGKIADTFDVVIIGYYFGKGKRTQFEFGGVLTAVYDPESLKFKSIAKVGTGFSEEQMGEFANRLEKISLKEKPANVDCEMTPDVWVRPEIVIEVNADEITQSPTHTCGRAEGEEEGYALRFPRMISLRKDKKPTDATTEAEIFEMYELQGQK